MYERHLPIPLEKRKSHLSSVDCSVYILLCEVLSGTGYTFTEANQLCPTCPEPPRASYDMHVLLYLVYSSCLKIFIISYNMISNTSQLLHMTFI